MRRSFLILLLVLWSALVAMAVELYYFQPELRNLALVVSWFGGLVSFPLLAELIRRRS